MELPNELIIKIINYCDNKTLLNFKAIEEFNIFNNDIDKKIHKNSIIEWKEIQYEYIKNTLKNKIFEDMKKIYIFNYGYGEFRQVIINFPFQDYKNSFDKYWEKQIDIILDNTDFKQIKIDKIIINIKKTIPLLRNQYTETFYNFPSNVFNRVYFNERF